MLTHSLVLLFLLPEHQSPQVFSGTQASFAHLLISLACGVLVGLIPSDLEPAMLCFVVTNTRSPLTSIWVSLNPQQDFIISLILAQHAKFVVVYCAVRSISDGQDGVFHFYYVKKHNIVLILLVLWFAAFHFEFMPSLVAIVLIKLFWQYYFHF